MYKRKLEVPSNFMEYLYESMNGYEEEDLLLIEEEFVIRTMNRYSMECRNVIIEVMCDIFTIEELSNIHDIPEECIIHYCNDLKWRISRKYKIRPQLLIEEATSYSKSEINGLSLDSNLLQSELSRRASSALMRSNFESLGELLDYFEAKPIRLFQDMITGCSTDTIGELTSFCKKYVNLRNSTK